MKKSLALAALAAALSGLPSVLAHDLNHDGYEDIVIANYEDKGTFNLPSYVYWGSANSFQRRTELATHGARGISAVDLNRDGHLDVLVSNFTNGESRRIPSYIYWGDGAGGFQKRTSLATVSAFGHSVADLNGDGYLDIVFSNYSDGDNAAISSYIYWGDALFEFKRRTELPTHGALGNAIADLDGDGHLDIVFCSQNTEKTSAPSLIYWGDKSHAFTRKTQIPTRFAYDVSIGDLNDDGRPDLVFSDFSAEGSYIFWGGWRGSFTRKTTLDTHYATCNSVADLDGDGHEDIVFSCYKDKNGFDTESLIYWGGAKDPFQTSTRLATSGAHGHSVADLDRDGLADIVFANHHLRQSFVYLGSGHRRFDRVTPLETVGATGVSAGPVQAYGQNVPPKLPRRQR